LINTGNLAYSGGVVDLNGDIHFIKLTATVGQKISTTASLPFDFGTCCSSFLNKY
jgi:hypothetical protein